MKSLVLFIFLTILSIVAKSQSFAIINDKDGFVNVRLESNSKSAIVGKIYNDEIFGVEDEDISKTEWLKIYKQDVIDKHNLEGYIHKSRVFLLSNFKSLKKIKIYSDSCIAVNDSISVVVKSARFVAKNHKLLSTGGDKNYNVAPILNTIDGKHFWGTDGEIPKKVIISLNVKINGSLIAIPKSAFDDLYEPSFKSLSVYVGKSNIIYIQMDNSDGAGGYSVIWIIKNYKFIKRYMDNINV